MTIPTRLGLKRQQMSNEISYKPGKYLTKHLVHFAIVFVICLLITISNIPRFVNPTFEEEIIKKVSTITGTEHILIKMDGSELCHF